jgi:light-regulated signal transduction histidine kinase (bacteriophytochrome)
MNVAPARSHVERFRDIVALRLGLHFDDGKLDGLSEVLRERMATHGLVPFRAYESLGNAWKFTSRQARAEIAFGCERRDEGLVYFVRDNGAGFDTTYAAKLFGAFQRLHAVADFEGTGIGLATVQRVVHRHEGRVWAEGNVGLGATFFFTLGPRSPLSVGTLH